MNIDALAVGHVTLDHYVTGLRPGGSVLYAGRAWRALGRSPGLVTTIGADFLTPSSLTGLTVQAGPSPRTTRFANRYQTDGSRAQHLAAQAPTVGIDLLPAAWRAPKMAFLCPVLGEVDIAAWQPALRQAEVLGVGLQGWLKRAEGDGTVAHGPDGVDPRQFHGVDVAFLSEEDLAGRLDWLDALCQGVPLVYLTRGAQGCLIFRPGTIDRVGVFETGAVDPTGAGDTFAAATLHALADGAHPIAAARMGAAAASVVVEYQASAPLPALRRAPARLDAVGVG
jgi:hypothetical protein